MSDPRTSNSRLVYSSDGGRVREPAAPPGRKQVGKGSAPSVPNDGIVRVQRDRRGRGGKTATTVTGLPGSDAELDVLLKRLKQHCGSGGSRDGRVLVLQGDQRERLVAHLESLGHRVKLAGG
ncbi:MAG: translation initiation factor [Hyphomicrobiales bacterium]